MAYGETNGAAGSDIPPPNLKIEVKHNKKSPIRIKPSEERADKQPIYILSDLDQSLAFPLKTIHLYKSSSKENEEHSVVVEVVSNSLSKILTHYYPLAGKLGMSPEGKLVVECTNEGVLFMEAKANCVMDDVLLRVDELDAFVYDVPFTNVLEIPLMTVQVTSLECGGFAVGIAMNHCMFDGSSEVEFLKKWGEIARGLPLDTHTIFHDRSIFNARDSPIPPKSHPGITQLFKETSKSSVEYLYDDDQQPVEYRSFVFDEEKIQRLKSMALEEGSGISKCSTFDVLTAFIWKAKTKAFGIQPDEEIKVVFSVDVRSKLKQYCLPKSFFGNAVVLSNSSCTAGELVDNFSNGVKLVQEAKMMVNEEYVRSFIDYNGMSNLAPKSLSKTLLLSVWSDLGFHEMDFGWGEAIYTGPVLIPEGKAIIVMFLPYGKNKKGVVVKIGLPRSVMKSFEQLVMQI